MKSVLNQQFVPVILSLLNLWVDVSIGSMMKEGLEINVKLPDRDNDGPAYFVGTEKGSWYEAEESCRRVNMRLASIKGQISDQRVSNTIEEARGKDLSEAAGHFWTSGNDLAELGKFYWMSTGEQIDRYTNWLRGEPSKEERSYKNWKISPHCIFLNRHKTKYYWEYGPCIDKKYFVCEVFERKWRSD